MNDYTKGITICGLCHCHKDLCQCPSALSPAAGSAMESVKAALKLCEPYTEAISVFMAHVPIMAEELRLHHPHLGIPESHMAAAENMMAHLNANG